MENRNDRNGQSRDRRRAQPLDPRYAAPGIAEPYDYPTPTQPSRGSAQTGRSPGRAGDTYDAQPPELGWYGEQQIPGAFGDQQSPPPRYAPQGATGRRGDVPTRQQTGMGYYGPGRQGQFSGEFHNSEWSRPEERMRTAPSPYEHRDEEFGYRNYGDLMRYNESAQRGRMIDFGRDDLRVRYRGEPQSGEFIGVAPMGYRRSATSIREEVCQRLTDHPAANPSKLEVEVDDDGVVTLKGHVDSRRSKRLMEDVADYVRGVVDVRNQLEIDASQFEPPPTR